jgi:hypothetical protein
MTSICRMLLALCLILLAGCKQQVPAKYDRGTEETAVYQAVIDQHYASERLLMLQANTITGPMGKRLSSADAKQIEEKFGSALQKETLADFRTQVKETAWINKSLKTVSPYVLVKLEEVQRIYDQGMGWDGIKARYPGVRSFVKLSRAGFNMAGDQALVYLESSGEARAGGGLFILLHKTENGWIIDQTVSAWIA